MKFLFTLLFSVLFTLFLPEQIRLEDIDNYYTIWASNFSFDELQLKEKIEILSRIWFFITGRLNFFSFHYQICSKYPFCECFSMSTSLNRYIN